LISSARERPPFAELTMTAPPHGDKQICKRGGADDKINQRTLFLLFPCGTRQKCGLPIEKRDQVNAVMEYFGYFGY
jgi:hypothetical protein